MIKITYTSHILPTSTLEVEHPFHKIKNSMLFIAILSKLKGHGLAKKREKIWTNEGPKHSKEKEKKFGHMKVQHVSKES